MAGHLILSCPLYGFNENWDRWVVRPSLSPLPLQSTCISRITDQARRISLWGEPLPHVAATALILRRFNEFMNTLKGTL